ncbi:hypothetical protein LINGRAHAP2_LOCUS8484 [Linum grandiflorum]
MANSSGGCLCNKKSKVLRIVYPGGLLELHEKPILAGDIMAKHPKFTVARPEVFRQPLTAVVTPETKLMLGQKFYMVPASTVRKLQRKYVKHNPASSFEGHNNGRRRSTGCLSTVINSLTMTGDQRNRHVNDDHRMVRIVYKGDRSSGGSSCSSGSFGSPVGDRLSSSSPKKGLHMDYYWTPNLESITEETS